VDARDVLDANGKTKRAFSAEIIGHYRRTGPNSWDDYEYVSRPEGSVDVLPGLRIQLERHGPTLRMRIEGRVVRVRWKPTAEQQLELDRSGKEIRSYFVSEYISAFDEAEGAGAAVFAGKLRR
jgi:hypothetical protein